MGPTITKQEYQSRCERLQTKMKAEGINALIIFSWKRGHVRYLSGYHPNFIANLGMVILPVVGSPTLIIRFPFDLERARSESWIENIEASGNDIKIAGIAARRLRENGLATGKIGLITSDSVIDEMPYRLYAALKSELPGVQFVDAEHILNQARRKKSNAEFVLLSDSAILADKGVEAARKMLQPGVSEYEVVAAAEGKMRALGADMHLVAIASRGVTDLIHPPTANILDSGDGVLVEIAVQRAGYTTQVAHTFFVGQPTGAHLSIYQATYQAYQDGIAAARPGSTCEQLAAAIQDSFSKTGYSEYMAHDLGHGIGIDLPEGPRIEHGDTTIIEPGMALVIHPSIRVPGTGCAFIGGTVLISETGAKPLHIIPPDPN